MVKKRWPNFKQHRSKTKCDAARWCPAPPATARTHTRGHRSVSKDGPVWKAGGDRVGPLWQRCEGNRSKEGNVTVAGRHGPRNGRPPTLSPPPPLLLSPLGLCPLWRELGSPPALSGACRRRPFTADSPHHVLAGETGQCPGTGRYFSPSSQGPAVQGSSGGRGRVRRLPPRAAIKTEAVTAASVSPGHSGAASCPAHRCVSIIGKGAGAFTY